METRQDRWRIGNIAENAENLDGAEKIPKAFSVKSVVDPRYL
ncbi:MAG: hypothetical protein AB1656_10660 [Candidatus Omnitrophota bacterium]